MISKNKKAIMFEFLVRLIIALVFIFGAFYIAKSLFRLSSAADESFNKLAEMIDSVGEDETTTMALIMDKGTAIAIFNKDKNELHFYVTSTEIVTGVGYAADLPGSTKYSMKKPDSCLNTSDCACLCKKVKINIFEYACMKSYCKNIESNTLPLYKQCDTTDRCIDSSEGGSIFIRGIDQLEAPRAKTIYATEYNGFVAVCRKSPCPPESIRKERIEVPETEVRGNYLYHKDDLIRVTDEKIDIEYSYYIVNHKKDLFGIYYYEYNSAIGDSFRTDPSTKEAIISEKTKEFFEEKRMNNLQSGKSVQVLRPSLNPKKDLKDFEPNLNLTKDGTLQPITS